jgi:hypothetical protein
MSYKPAIRMVPAPLWGMNLRRMLPKSRWNKLRKNLIAECGLKCQTCGKVETESKRIFAHEEWEYDTGRTPAIARLAGLKLSCWHCHAVEHFGATGNMVRSGELTEKAIEDTIENFCRLNGVGHDEFRAHLAEAKAEWIRSSHLQWKVDWGPFTSLVAAAEQKRRVRMEGREEDYAEEIEDMALYEWPYLHSGEPI